MWKIQVFVFSSVAQLCLTLARQASLSITNSQSLTDSCPSHRWCRPTVSSSVIPFFSCPQSFPASGYCIWNFLKLKKIVFDPLLVAPLDSEPAETRRLTELSPCSFHLHVSLRCCVVFFHLKLKESVILFFAYWEMSEILLHILLLPRSALYYIGCMASCKDWNTFGPERLLCFIFWRVIFLGIEFLAEIFSCRTYIPTTVWFPLF